MERDASARANSASAAVFSFYATKNITCGDGGAIATRRHDLTERLRRLRNHGMSRAATERHGESHCHWDIVELGYKGNLTDLQAALLRPQLAWIESRLARREALARRYEARLREAVPALRGPTPSERGVPWLVEPRGTSGRNLFTLHAPALRRDAILASLGTQGIGTAVNFRAIHRLSYFASTLAPPRGCPSPRIGLTGHIYPSSPLPMTSRTSWSPPSRARSPTQGDRHHRRGPRPPDPGISDGCAPWHRHDASPATRPLRSPGRRVLLW